MAGKIIAAQFATIGTATTTGYITIPSVAGFYKGAKAWLSKAATTSQRVVITEVNATANTLGVRIINDDGSVTNNFGRSDVSAFATTGRIDQEEQFVYSPNDTGLS
jgi:hypothetical protein